MIRRGLLLIVLCAGCSVESEPPVTTGDEGATTDGGAPDHAVAPADRDLALTPVDATHDDLSRLGPATYLLRLDAGAFPPTKAHPSALVYLPSSFRPAPPIPVIVFLHGWNNCVENVVRDAGASCNPGPGTPSRQAYSLAAQLEASGKNALLLCPEVVFDQPTGDPGNLGKTGGFRALLDETLKNLAPLLGPLTADDVGPVALASHSGGYQAAGAIATRGGVPVAEIFLLDSLYGNTADFDAWVKKDLPALAGANPARRFADVYTAGGGTLQNSQQMAVRAKSWVVGDPGILVDDRTQADWPAATYHHGLLFKYSGLSHDGVVRYYFGQLVASSSLPAK
ncbi:MAG: hypothetical protein EXR72_16845 [Myxococcales bacterium]|nr:hypothetical protein [Myxococcales bacterium]